MKLISIIFCLIVTVYSQQNIIEYLQTATGFDVCAGALIKLNTSAGIDVTTGGPYTVFCAPDTVWNPMGITDGSTLDDTLISYWIIMGEFNNTNLVAATYPTLARKITTLPYEFEYNGAFQITDDGGNVVSTTTLTQVSSPGNIWITNNGVIFPGTILDYLKDNPTTYATLSSVAGGVTSVATALSGPGPLTLFAPPNTAFDAIDEGVLSLLVAPANSGELESVLLHHVLAAKVASSTVTDGLIATTAQGSNLTFAVTTGIFVTDALTRGTSCQIGVDSVDIFRSNGVIHSTACVLTPKSLADVVVENGLTSIAQAAVTYGVSDALLAPGGITLFGPTNAAFNAVNLTGFGPEDIAFILAYHTIPAGVPSAVVANFSGQNVATSINATVRVAIDISSSVTITDSISQVSTVTVVDKFALNGILHIIDGVLFPASIVQIAKTNPLTNEVADQAVQAGLTDALTGITMFLPTNVALIANLGALFNLPGRTANFVFQYHVITQSLFADIPNNPETTTASLIFFNITSGQLIINYDLLLDQMGNRVTDERGNTVNIIDLDIVGTDGTINIIDNFLFPFDISSIASIDATAKATSDLSTLVAAYTTAGLDTTLALTNMLGLTIFAPTNSAFGKLADGLIPYLLTNITLLESVLSLHVYNGTLLAQDIALLGNQGQPITTLAGIDLIIGLTADQAAFTLTDPAGNVITITAFDIFCTNGVVHLIDTVIESSPGAYDFTIADYLAVYNDTDIIFGTFGILTNIITTLPFLSFSMNVSDANAMNTLFAPLDISFGSLNINQTKLLSVTSNPVTLERLLGYHLVSGKVLSTDIMNNSLVTTSSGDNFTTILSDLGVEIMDMDDYNDNSIVTMANIQVTNGIIHIIDRVLGPETGFITKPVTSIYDYIIDNQDAKMLTTLATQISRSEELILFLDEFGPFTIFAPNDGAFVSSDIDPTDLAALLSNVTMVELLLTYHLVGGLVYSSNLTDGMMVETFLGENIKISKNGSGVFIKDVSTVNSDAQVVFADIVTDNGIIHIIDNVLQYEDGLLTPTSAPSMTPSMTPTMATMPPTANTIVNFVIENQEVKELTTLASVITPFVAEVLNMDGPYTLFAPIDSAWNNSDIDATKLEKILKPENNETLTKLLKYHVLDGMVFAENLTDGKTAQTLKGLDITIKIKNDTVFIKDIETSNDDNTAKVTKADIVVSNGIIHLIDGVLSFEEGLLSPDMPTLPPTGASNIIRPSLIIITIIIAIVLG